MAFPIDHDMHCHTLLSACSGDPQQNVQAILAHARQHGYTLQCITDHLWDSLVPGASSWYAPQDVAHVKQNKPLPQDDQVKMVFGCETEYCGGSKIGLHPSHYDDFDFIIIPPNHFHMVNFVRPDTYDTAEKVAELFVERLEQLVELDLPWHKVGIAHMNCGLTFPEGSATRVFSLMDEQRCRSVLHRFAQLRAGLEINVSCFAPGWRTEEAAHLRLFRLAKQEGCKFYLGSDAHHPQSLEAVPERGAQICTLLGLEESDRFCLRT